MPQARLIRSTAPDSASVTDHRIGLTVHQFDQLMDGKLQPFIDALLTHYNAEKMKEQAAVTT